MQDHSDVKKQQLKFDFNARELKYFNSVSLDSVIFKITTSSDITIPTKTLILSLNVNNQEFPVNITNQVSDGDSEDVFGQYCAQKAVKRFQLVLCYFSLSLIELPSQYQSQY